ncbi:MAG: hypothetical protein AB1306_04595 [Nitrospirota bacterium]
MIYKSDTKSYLSLALIILLTLIYSFLLPISVAAQTIPIDAKLSETEKNINILWPKTHHFERECPSKENATLAQQIIDDLEIIYRENPAYKSMDKVLFMLAQAKTMMVDMCNCYTDQSDYCGNRKEYLNFFGQHYLGNEYEELIKRYPKSPYLEYAIFYHASDLAATGECEGDMNCYVGRSINAYLPYVLKYPDGGHLALAMKDINWRLSALNFPPRSGGGDFWDLKAIDKLLKTYHTSVLKIKNNLLKDDALYYLARGYIAACQYDKAMSMYENLEKNSSKYRNAKIMTAYEMFGYKWETKLADTNYNKKVLTIIKELQHKDSKNKLKALTEIKNKQPNDISLLMPVFMKIGQIAIRDSSATVRREAILTAESFLSEPFFASLNTNGANCKYCEDPYSQYEDEFPHPMNYFHYSFLKPLVRHCLLFERNISNLDLCKKMKIKYDVDVCDNDKCY